MEIRQCEADGVIHAEVHGVLNTAAAAILEHAAREWAQRAQVRVQIDLGGVHQIFAGGLAGLVAVHRLVAQTGGRVVFVAPKRFGREILRLTQVDRLITVVADHEAARQWVASATMQLVTTGAKPPLRPTGGWVHG